jgi:phosphonopyruvate decarboxylase
VISQKKFVNALYKNGVEFFCGVPDSHLNAFCSYINNHVPSSKNIIAANEGNAVALASGYYFATGSVPLVYMQNSGMGNALNPLVSLVDRHVYSVPMVLLIGWRGEPLTGDHEQHRTQGEITTKLLDMLAIPYKIVKDDDSFIGETVAWAVQTASSTGLPTALIAQKGVFAEAKKKSPLDDSYPMSREDAIKVVLDNVPKDTLFVATTGRATRELYFLRDERGETHNNDVLNVGSMGHASSIAMGLALANKDRLVVCLDGDAAAIMHLGALTMVSKYEVPNFVHIILNNGAHESVGGQPSVGHIIDFAEIAGSCGYRSKTVDDEKSLIGALGELTDGKAASLINVKIRQGMRPVLPPLKIDHNKLISDFMNKNIVKENGRR